MSETIKLLGQLIPAANTLTDVYAVPIGSTSVLSSVTLCNQSTSSTTFRLSIAIAAAVDSLAQYLYYDELVPAKRTFALTLGLTLGAGDVLRFSSNNGQMSINAFGVQTS